MLTIGDHHEMLAGIAGVERLRPGGSDRCDEMTATGPCARDAVAVHRSLDQRMCVGHLKLAAAMALELDAWDNDGVRR